MSLRGLSYSIPKLESSEVESPENSTTYNEDDASCSQCPLPDTTLHNQL